MNKEKYYIGRNHCNCHPETCCCNDWAIYDSEDDEVFETFFRESEAKARLLELETLDLVPLVTQTIKRLKKDLADANKAKKIALRFLVKIKNKGDFYSGRWCATEARDAFEKITGTKIPYETIHDIPEELLDVDAICKERDEAVIQLQAWQKAFGTTQLTHTLARLEAAEKKSRG